MFRGFISTQDHVLAPRDTRTRPLNVPTFLVATHRTITPPTRAKHTDTTRMQAKRQSQACAARRSHIRSRQDDAQTRRGRRSRAPAVPKRRRMSRAGGAGGRCAQGEAEGLDRGCCGYRACTGDGLTAPAKLRGVRRFEARAGLCHCRSLVFCVIGKGSSSPIVDLGSFLRTTAPTSQQCKQGTRGRGCAVGGRAMAAPGGG